MHKSAPCSDLQDLWKSEGGEDGRANQMPLQQHLQQPLPAMLQPPLVEQYAAAPQDLAAPKQDAGAAEAPVQQP